MITMRSEMTGIQRWLACLVIMTSFVGLSFAGDVSAAPGQRVFPSPEDAVRSLIDAVRQNDTRELLAIFGPSGKDLVFSGDPNMDAQGRAHFLKAYEQKNRLEYVHRKKIVLHVGENDWPMPIPMIKVGKTWQFDTKEGRSEILARRIGRDELSAVQVCLAYVDAQREYAREHQGTGGAEYARQFLSDPGKKNGLCWEEGKGDNPPGPMGPLIAGACPASFSPQERGKAVPYHGYFYKILTAQGKNASGGAYDYVVKGRMIGGFGLVAYPARYRSTGVMTFIVNHDGTVYQKDLGKNTTRIAEKMTVFDPDRTWRKLD